MRFMTAKRYTLDTNILVYAIDKDEGEKHQQAFALLDKCVEYDTVLTVQALSEFFYVVTRKNKLLIQETMEQIQDWQELFPTVGPRATTLQYAIATVTEHQLAFWDAMLFAVAKEHHVSCLLSEDFIHGKSIDGVEFQNPFREFLCTK